MLKIICKHILYHWKKNSWIMLELLLVFCLVWYMVDYFFVLGYNKGLTSHRDLQNTYMVNIGRLPELHHEFSAENAEPTHDLENFRRVIKRISEHPEVETVALALGYYALPSLANYHEGFRSVEDTTKVAEPQLFRFIPEEDYFQVFRHTTDGGKTQVKMQDYDFSDPTHILITRMLEEQLFPGGSAIGKWIEQIEPPHIQYRVTGILDDIKHHSFRRPYAAMFIPEHMHEENYRNTIISIRTTSPLPAIRFIPAFKKEMSAPLRIGNYYLGGLDSFSWMAKDMNYKVGLTNNVRMSTALMIFLFMNIMLCIFGTFWYRIHVRREEIGIRRAMGSTMIDIQKNFIWEGLILLTLIVIPAMLIESQFILAGLIETLGEDFRSYGNYLPDQTILRFLITNLITWIILAGMVMVAIWYPAYSASRIRPVDALRDE